MPATTLNEEYEYKVIRPKFTTDKELEDIFNIMGSGGWLLIALLQEPLPEVGPYMAVFCHKKTA